MSHELAGAFKQAIGIGKLSATKKPDIYMSLEGIGVVYPRRTRRFQRRTKRFPNRPSFRKARLRIQIRRHEDKNRFCSSEGGRKRSRILDGRQCHFAPAFRPGLSFVTISQDRTNWLSHVEEDAFNHPSDLAADSGNSIYTSVPFLPCCDAQKLFGLFDASYRQVRRIKQSHLHKQ
jgi:hypothetical protein